MPSPDSAAAVSARPNAGCLSHHTPVSSLCPPAGSIVIPIGLEAMDGGQAVHTVLVFPSPVATGKQAARQLHVTLLGDVRHFFTDPAFGQVHMETVSHPYLADAKGADIGGNLPNTNLAAQFSMEWLDVAPSAVSDARALAFQNAIKAKLPAGAPQGAAQGSCRAALQIWPPRLRHMLLPPCRRWAGRELPLRCCLPCLRCRHAPTAAHPLHIRRGGHLLYDPH